SVLRTSSSPTTSPVSNAHSASTEQIVSKSVISATTPTRLVAKVLERGAGRADRRVRRDERPRALGERGQSWHAFEVRRHAARGPPRDDGEPMDVAQRAKHERDLLEDDERRAERADETDPPHDLDGGGHRRLVGVATSLNVSCSAFR